MGITNKEINSKFGKEVTDLPGGEWLNRCFSCGACSGAGPVSLAIPDFDPRKIIHMIRMGLKDRVLSSDLLWYCSNCRSCVFVCPQNVGFADIMAALRKIAIAGGYVSEQDLRDKGKVAWVDQDQCVSCLTCVRVCPWSIPKINAKGVAVINAECRACGICVTECPAQTIKLNTAEDEKLLAACGIGK